MKKNKEKQKGFIQTWLLLTAVVSIMAMAATNININLTEQDGLISSVVDIPQFFQKSEEVTVKETAKEEQEQIEENQNQADIGSIFQQELKELRLELEKIKLERKIEKAKAEAAKPIIKVVEPIKKKIEEEKPQPIFEKNENVINPIIKNIVPDMVLAGVNDYLTIKGSYFQKDAEVIIGGVNYKISSFLNSETISIKIPSGNSGVPSFNIYNVEIKNPDGGKHTLKEALTIVDWPTPLSTNDESPKVSDILIKNVTANSVTINWSTDKPAISMIRYGENNNFNHWMVDPEFSTSHSLTLLALGKATTYQYEIISQNKAKNQTSSRPNFFSTFHGLKNGTATIAVDENSPDSFLLTKNSSNEVTLAVFKLSADYIEDLNLEQIDIIAEGKKDIVSEYHIYSNLRADGESTVEPIISTRMSEIKLPTDAVVILANDYILITVKAVLINNVDDIYLSNGDYIKIKIAATVRGKASDAVSAAKNNNISIYKDPAVCKIYKSKPTFSLNQNSPSGIMMNSYKTLLAIFDITADSGGDITFDNWNGNKLNVFTLTSNFNYDGNEEKIILMDEDNNVLDELTQDIFNQTMSFDFSTKSLVVPAGKTKSLYIYGDTTELSNKNGSIQLELRSNPGNTTGWGINGRENYLEAEIIFKNKITAHALTNFQEN